ncbi:MAG: monooxygenase [Dermatophilus congolensis]|nr:monooxygenase [Dermatophilus congolensis]
MPTLVQVNFPLDGPWGEAMSQEFVGLATSINAEPGFIWKIWIENEAERASGGIYLFDTLENAQNYVAMHTDRLAGFGITGLNATYSEVNVPLSTLNRATLTATR